MYLGLLTYIIVLISVPVIQRSIEVENRATENAQTENAGKESRLWNTLPNVKRVVNVKP